MEIEMVPEGRTPLSCGRHNAHGEAPPSSGTSNEGRIMKYSEKLKDPRWQKKRLKIFERDEWKCQWCLDEGDTLAVHHYYYENGLEPWDYPNEDLVTVCQGCHDIEYCNRREMEQSLLDVLRRKHYRSSDVEAIVCALANLPDDDLTLDRIIVRYMHDGMPVKG
jgi:hypothetical protein